MSRFNLVNQSLLAICSLYAGTSVAITMPAPPPELPDTLTKFRTLEQINENKTRENDSLMPFTENVEIESAPFVPGDDTAGIVRLDTVYTAEATIGVPNLGASIVRIYDLEGVPFEISSVRCENQGFLAEVTASPYELLIKQNLGASTTKMVVTLENYDNPLVFSLTPVKLVRDEIAINTIINTIQVKSYTNAQGYVFPEIHEVPKPNPSAEVVKLDNADIKTIEQNLIEAVRGLKENAQ